MTDRILFIVINGEIKFIKNPTMDHKEWFQSLGGNMEEYDDTIRGFVMEGKIIFCKANLNYDSEVIDFATKMAIPMKKQLNKPDLKVCCGIDPGQNGGKWEAILFLNEKDLEGYVAPEKGIPEMTEDVILQRKANEPVPKTSPETDQEAIPEMEEQLEIQKQKELEEAQRKANEPPAEPIIEFKNDIKDSNFTKQAVNFTIKMLVVAVITKAILIGTGKILTDSRWNMLLIFVQIGTLVFSIVGYSQHNSKTRYFALAGSIASIFLFDLIDIIIGVLIFLFTIDYTYITKIKEGILLAKNKLKELLNKAKNKQNNSQTSTITPIQNNGTLPQNTQNTTPPPTINNH